jgi:uncharacterized protein
MQSESLPHLGVDGRILEGIVTTQNADGTVNIAPMGPIVGEDCTTFVFRPFKSSTTYENLIRTGSGVLHVTDDVELFAAAAIGAVSGADFRADRPLVLSGACRWYAFEISSIDDVQEQTTLIARTTDHGTQREFFGFNRAQHAVIEAAILATRLHLLPADEVLAEFARLQVLVDKTGAAAEHRAFSMLRQLVESSTAGALGGRAHP